MVDSLKNWAIFGVMAVLWSYAFGWVVARGGSPEVIVAVVSLITMSLMSGKTSGDNGIAHVIDGLKGCMVLVIGWIVASLVHDILLGLIKTQTVDAMGVMNGAIDTVVIVLASVVVFSSLNAVRD